MKRYSFKSFFHPEYAANTVRVLILFCVAALSSFKCVALPTDLYASESKLADGKWAKIEVASTGMQLITRETLKSLGFSDINKVNVYGYGGNMLSEKLDSSMHDDLPLIPSLHTPKGIIFFGLSTLSWLFGKDLSEKPAHSLNPYSSKSYYFISERDATPVEPATKEALESQGGDIITRFEQHLVHENDIIAPSNTGRMMLGEDFRTQNKRTFNFSLPGIISPVTMSVRFGAKVTNGTSSLMFYANNVLLPSTESDIIRGVPSSETFLVTTTTEKTIENVGENLNLSISYSNSGAIFTAALDYIRLSYIRELRLHKGVLNFQISPDSPTKVHIEDCDANTVIWDVTDKVKPIIIPHTLSGTVAEFTSDAGFHEYIAFNPATISQHASPAGIVSNQNLHGKSAPDMLIIAPSIFREAAERIAALHSDTDGLSTLIVTPETIYNEFSSGVPDVTAFRKLLKMWYDRRGASGGDYTKYCLIMGRPTYDNRSITPVVRNAGYPRVPIWQSPEGFSEATSYSCDDYIGMLEDYRPGWDIGNAAIHVAVGRMPVKSVAEALSAATKLEKYVREPQLGQWRNNVMVIADDQDNGIHLKQAENVCSNMLNSPNGNDYVYERLYLDAYNLGFSGTGAVYPEARERMFSRLNEGVMFWNYIGHASPKGWGHENLLTSTDIKSLSNRRLPFLYAATCEFMRWDADEVSGGEEMWLNPNAGVIGMICPSRTVYISLNGELNACTSQFFLSRDNDGKGMRIGDIMIAGKNSMGKDTNKLRYGLMGDPAMRLPAPEFKIEVDSIITATPNSEGDLPILSAGSSVTIEGRVIDIDGNTAEDFNGIAEIRLYDAEKVVTTNGNGSSGTAMEYNDRTTRLFSGRARVTEGLWRTVVNIPMDIENNYSPALLSLYASDSSGREASGSTDRFYVYGASDKSQEDTEGPIISAFYLNTQNFNDGSSVGPSPIVKAVMSDDSGINLSESGIGHGISLTLDEKTFFTDLTPYFTPDADEPGMGELSYSMENIEPGEHTLKLNVWDNAGNSSSASLSFRVEAGWSPSITSLLTDANPASSGVNFLIESDSPVAASSWEVEVFDISGRKVWTGESTSSGSFSSTSIYWDLCDYQGARVPRGIYPYRARIITREGRTAVKSGKLAVTTK